MKPEASELSPQESLYIITDMIHQAKGNVQRNSFYFLLWGWVVTLANLGMYLLTRLDYEHPYIVWLITIPAWVISLYRGFKARKEKRSTSHFDTISASLWMAFGIVIFTLVVFGSRINYQLNPVILLISALPTLVSGIILKFRPMIFGGILFWVFGIIGFLVPMELQPLVGAAAIICGYLIPGYLLKKQTV